MKTILSLAVSIALIASLAGAESRKQSPKAHGPTLLSVTAYNYAIPGGQVSAPTLQEAETLAKQETALDPVCYAVPELCISRYENTVYVGFYSDGSSHGLTP